MARAQGVAAVESASHCSSDSVHDLHLAWTAKLGASIYSSPLIMPADRGGTEIWVDTGSLDLNDSVRQIMKYLSEKELLDLDD